LPHARAGFRIELIVALAVCLSPCLAVAQWLDYPTAGVPRNPDGSPNLKAPVPRATDGKPDLSGTWEPEKNKPCPPEGCDDIQVPQEFPNIGWSVAGGLPFQPWALDLKKARQARYSIDDPATQCLPVGIIKTLTAPLLKKLVQTPGLLLILSERNAMYRQIFTDGRPLPVDPQPSWNGYSSGKWEGDTLVVQSNGFREDGWLDRGGTPATDALRLTERFHRVNFGRMEIDVNVDDPKAYTRPWTVKLVQTIALDTDLLDYICLENEKDREHMSPK
jgi:hypothetical protein